MDFIKKLPSSSEFDTILVIVNWLTKQAIFIPAHDTITSVDLACLFVFHVFSKHGIPSHVTSNRDLEFVSNFFRSLGTALDMRLHFTSDYHSEDNGQTEHTNQTLKQYLCVYCNYQQDNWSKLLPLTEFAYNNCYELKSLEWNIRTTLVLSNTRELDRELFYKLVYLI